MPWRIRDLGWTNPALAAQRETGIDMIIDDPKQTILTKMKKADARLVAEFAILAHPDSPIEQHRIAEDISLLIAEFGNTIRDKFPEVRRIELVPVLLACTVKRVGNSLPEPGLATPAKLRNFIGPNPGKGNQLMRWYQSVLNEVVDLFEQLYENVPAQLQACPALHDALEEQGFLDKAPSLVALRRMVVRHNVEFGNATFNPIPDHVQGAFQTLYPEAKKRLVDSQPNLLDYLAVKLVCSGDIAVRATHDWKSDRLFRSNCQKKGQLGLRSVFGEELDDEGTPWRQHIDVIGGFKAIA